MLKALFRLADRKLAPRVAGILGRTGATDFLADDAWARKAQQDVASATLRERAAWNRLCALAASSEGSKPSARFLKDARPLIDAIGTESFTQKLAAWSALVGPRQVENPAPSLGRSADPRMTLRNATLLRGLVWAASLVGTPEICRVLGDLGISAFKKIPAVGAVSARVGNACIWSLGAITGTEPVAQLGRLGRKVKYALPQRLVAAALEEAARRAGISREDLEEIALPTFGLEIPGRRVESLGAHTAELRVEGDSVQLVLRESTGKVLKNVPAQLKAAHQAEIDELKQAKKDLEAILPAQRERLEHLFLAERSWSYEAWRERYLDHPLVGGLARRLIWSFGEGSSTSLATWSGALVTLEGSPLNPQSGTRVTLWHPLGTDPAVVHQWRRFLEDREIVQPFKQAHREIYVLTDAELATATYSNRFASHVLRQHQLATLCRERGWNYTYRGGFDSHNVPVKPFPRWGLNVEFWVEGIPDDTQVSASGIYLHVSTGQVRFVGSDGPRLLSQVPPLLFSEVMRDIDLFVGACSIGTDPHWRDRGDHPHLPYWNDFAFGDLNHSAITRRKVLENLLPRISALKDVTELDGRFLRVKGKLRSYKVHLGSGNILMDPNDQYLCIVPDRSARESRVLLPFEGDSMMSVILSKAFLLAADHKIKDATIVSQILQK